MQKVVVVIPTHKANPTDNELASFRQCYKILGTHPIRIVAPEGLEMSVYKNAVPETEIVFIDPIWLSSIEQYNKLKISLYFYHLFRDYEYLLTYELDAWVFRDELLYWCDKGYDYIGAPWFEGYINPTSYKIVDVGNSGFSLRKVNSALDITKRLKIMAKWRRFWYKTRLQAILRFESKVLEKIFKIHFNPYTINLFANWQLQEDYYWAKYVSSSFPEFRVAPKEEGVRFSFECNPSLLFKMNSEQLPFGCHAWEKYELEFWEEYIELKNFKKEPN